MIGGQRAALALPQATGCAMRLTWNWLGLLAGYSGRLLVHVRTSDARQPHARARNGVAAEHARRIREKAIANQRCFVGSSESDSVGEFTTVISELADVFYCVQCVDRRARRGSLHHRCTGCEDCRFAFFLSGSLRQSKKQSCGFQLNYIIFFRPAMHRPAPAVQSLQHGAQGLLKDDRAVSGRPQVSFLSGRAPC